MRSVYNSMARVFMSLACVIVCVFFFFQAEDGIRDVAVTGVQTCALPIFPTACVELAPIAYSLLVSNRILKPDRERVLIFPRGRIGGFVEKWLVGPVVAI